MEKFKKEMTEKLKKIRKKLQKNEFIINNDGTTTKVPKVEGEVRQT